MSILSPPGPFPTFALSPRDRRTAVLLSLRIHLPPAWVLGLPVLFFSLVYTFPFTYIVWVILYTRDFFFYLLDFRFKYLVTGDCSQVGGLGAATCSWVNCLPTCCRVRVIIININPFIFIIITVKEIIVINISIVATVKALFIIIIIVTIIILSSSYHHHHSHCMIIKIIFMTPSLYHQCRPRLQTGIIVKSRLSFQASTMKSWLFNVFGMHIYNLD